MTLSDLASVGSFVSGVAVLVSLIYLALQVRQAKRNQQAQITQTRTTRSIDILMHFSTLGLVEADIRARMGAADLKQTELQVFYNHSLALFSHWEDSFFQHAERLMTDRAFGTAVNLMRGTLANPGSRVVWRRTNFIYDADFRHFVDELMDDVQARPYEMGLDRWKADYDAELAEVPTPAG
jgi:hypothetical protein